MDIHGLAVSFTWAKPDLGYIWEDCTLYDPFSQEKMQDIPNPPFLVEKDYTQDLSPYQPFDDATLFAKFADLGASEELFAGWASDYGTLIGGENLKVGPLMVLPKSCINPKKPIHSSGISVSVASGGRGYLQPSESLTFWRKEHSELRFVVLLWELLQNEDTENLAKIVKWPGFGGVTVYKLTREQLPVIDFERLREDPKYSMEQGIRGEVLFDKGNIRPWLGTLTRAPDVAKPALLYAQLLINRKLKEYPLNVVLQMDERGGLYTKLQPTSLLAAMWYQLALAMKGDIKLRRCDICKQWEDMKGHRSSWTRHKACASNARVERFRNK